MDFIKKLEKILDERNKQLYFGCERIYFLSDLHYYNEDEERVVLPETDPYHYWFLDSTDNNSFHYDLRNKLYGLAEFLHKEDEGFDKNEVPLIQYEITDANKLLITCFVEKEFLKEHPDTIKKLNEYLDGQISDGWGENGFMVKNFMDDVKEVWSDGVRLVKKKMDLNSFDSIFEDYEIEDGEDGE